MCPCHKCNSKCNPDGGIRVYFRGDDLDGKHSMTEFAGANRSMVDPETGALYIARRSPDGPDKTLAIFHSTAWVFARKF